MHAVAPEVGSAPQSDDSGRPPARLCIGRPQALTLRRGKGAVVELEVQISHGPLFSIANLAACGEAARAVTGTACVGREVIAVRHPLGEGAERKHGVTFEAWARFVHRL